MEVSLPTGECAELLAVEGSIATLRSPRAFAPGSPMRFTAAFEETERCYEGRAIGSKRRADQTFEVRMRFVNLRREDRDALLGAIGAETAVRTD